jgi:hypothetical protein
MARDEMSVPEFGGISSIAMAFWNEYRGHKNES